MDEYQVAQRAIADLKSAALSLIRREGPISNAKLGRALGIYFGHGAKQGRHEGHVSRSILRLLADEGLVEQTSTKEWRYKTP